MTEQVLATPSPMVVQAPDPILAELWEVKRQINAEAGYRIETLVRMARDAAERANLSAADLAHE